MAKPKFDLQKIVSLKRQKAEQDFRGAQLELNRTTSEAQRLAEALSGMDSTEADFGALFLSHRNGHVQKLVKEIDASRTAVAESETGLRAAHELLKRAFDSEDRLKRMKE
jgi:hypothetical protein